MVQLGFLDADGEGTPIPVTPVTGTVYNGSATCKDCGSLIGPVQALSSDVCPPCSRRKAAKHLANGMA